jgi:hypothetical protein
VISTIFYAQAIALLLLDCIGITVFMNYSFSFFLISPNIIVIYFTFIYSSNWHHSLNEYTGGFFYF